MSNELIDSRKLQKLADQANAEAEQIESSMRSTVQHAIAAGALLLEAKSKVPHGQWLPWLKDNWRYSTDLANKYMRIANSERILNLDSASSISEALRMIADAKAEESPAAEGELVFDDEVIEDYQQNEGQDSSDEDDSEDAEAVDDDEWEDVPEDEDDDEEIETPLPNWYLMRGEVDAFRRRINDLLRDIKNVQETEGMELLLKSSKRIQMDLSNAKNAIIACVPFDICPYCSGMGNECTACDDRGWVSKFIWDGAPQEMRDAAKRLPVGGNR